MGSYLNTKELAGLVAGMILLPLLCVGAFHFRHPVKHTQNCMFISRTGQCDWFVRPNQEFFQACWDNPPQLFYQGMKLKDITYTDDNADMRHFIKAQVEPRK